MSHVYYHFKFLRPKRRILHVPNAFKTIDNQLKSSLSIVLDAFGACKMRRLEQA